MKHLELFENFDLIKEDNLYLTENVNYNKIIKSVEGYMSDPSKVGSIMDIWNECKKSNRYVRLKSLP